MATYQIRRAGDRLEIRKDGEKFGTQPDSKFPVTTAQVYRMMYERNGFDYWGVLALYFEAGAPDEWEGVI